MIWQAAGAHNLIWTGSLVNVCLKAGISKHSLPKLLNESHPIVEPGLPGSTCITTSFRSSNKLYLRKVSFNFFLFL
jgi:hypothetical protein